MSEYVISTCTTCDLTKDHLDSRQIKYIYFHYTKDGVNFDDDLYQTVSPADFYNSMVEGAEMKTSQVNTVEFMDFFTQFLTHGKDVIHVSLSSGISGVYSAAKTAATELQPLFPDRKIYVVDSLAASSGMGLLLDKMADLRDEGMSVEDLYSWVENNKLRLHHWFFTSDLTFFVKGGRVSKVSGALGGMLGICPLLNVSNTGKLIPRAKIRPKKKVIIETVKRMEEHADNGLDYSGKVFISQSNCIEDAKAVSDLIESKFKHINGGKVEIFNIGTVIGSHTGPGTVALFFWGDKRVD
ncbi:MAG: DegV family protein [Clostridia bacterium]|nr:DegV family protein [Clostridia bacterium]